MTYTETSALQEPCNDERQNTTTTNSSFLSTHYDQEAAVTEDNHEVFDGPHHYNHAETRWEDLVRVGPPQPPVERRLSDDEPEIHQAVRDVTVRVLLQDGQIREERVFLKRADDEKPADHCYRRCTEKKAKKVQFGYLLYAVQLDRVDDTAKKSTTTATTTNPIYTLNTNRYNQVVIKKQSKVQIRNYRRRGGHENPKVNILRMQQLGDNIHVLKCLEALEDKRYIYTIMPQCRTGSMLQCMEDDDDDDDGHDPESSDDGDDDMYPVETKARTLFRALMENLYYLHSYNICHHDLSPDNILETHDGQLVLVDLAMSFEMPTTTGAGRYDDDARPHHRTLVRPNGTYGKEPYLSPEVYMNSVPFDGCYLDLWAAGCILYNLLTKKMICLAPHPTDCLFEYFIMAGGLSNEPLNERTVEVLIDLYRRDEEEDDPSVVINETNDAKKEALLDHAMVHLNLSPHVVELLAGILHWNPYERWTLADVMQCEWLQQGNDDEYDDQYSDCGNDNNSNNNDG